uniref:nSTAND3 domain-containing NTPase n=1 Tax=Gemmiger formicilis TaxID=745368 RepID=UPI003FEFC9F4
MSKLTDIQYRIDQLDGGAFQNLCDAYLTCKGYGIGYSLGMKTGTNKTAKGNPDTYFLKKDGKYVFVMYTTQKDDFVKKALKDLEKCFDADKTGIPAENVGEIVYCHTCGRLLAGDTQTLNEFCKERNSKLTLIGLDELGSDLYWHYPRIAKDFLGVSVDTGQIMSIQDFVQIHDANKMSAPLETKFMLREAELKEAKEKLNLSDVLILSGPAGVGKTRLALQICRELASENGYEILCIKSNGLELYEDLVTTIEEDKNYLAFVDDANELTGLHFVLDFLCKAGDQKKSIKKLIVTVRDYARRQVLNQILEVKKPSIVKVGCLTDDEIRKLIKEAFGITNHIYSDRIVAIAEGNARLAMLAGKVAAETNSINSIQNATELYECYYANQIRTIVDSKSGIASAGIIAFFQVMRLDNLKCVQPILDAAGLTEEQFVADLRQFDKLELVDLRYDKAARISDQSFSNYLIKYVFVDQKVIPLSKMIEEGFFINQERTVVACNILLQVFADENVHKYVKEQIDIVWDHLKNSKEKFTPFFKVFYLIRPTETLVLLSDFIESEPARMFDVGTIKFEKNKSEKNIEDDAIKILCGFKATQQTSEAIELLLLYYKKRPDLFYEIYSALAVHFGVDIDSERQGYFVQERVVEQLCKAIESNQTTNLLRLFIRVADQFLKLSFSRTEGGRHNSIMFYTVALASQETVLGYRKMLLQQLYKLYEQNQCRTEIEDFLRDYGTEYGENEDYSIVKNELNLIEPFFALLSPERLYHCVIAKHIKEVSDRAEYVCYNTLEPFLNSKKYKIYSVLNQEPILLMDMPYDECENWHRKKVQNLVKEYKLCDFQYLFQVCTESMKTVDGDIWNLTRGIGYAINACVKNKVLYLDVVTAYLDADTPYNIYPQSVISNLFKLLSPEEVKEVLESHDYTQKNAWLWGFYDELPPEQLSLTWEENFLHFLGKIPKDMKSSTYRPLNRMEKFETVDEDVIIKASKIIVEHYEESPFVFSLYFSLMANPHNVSPNKVIEKYKKNISLLEEIYLKYLECTQNYDYDGSFFEALISKDKNFLYRYLDELLAKKRRLYGQHDEWVRRLLRIWTEDTYLLSMDLVSDYIYEKTEEKQWTYCQIIGQLLCHESGENEIAERQGKWIQHTIGNYCLDSERMCHLFGAIAEHDVNQKREALKEFLRCNSEYAVFEKLPLESSSWSWSGSEVPVIERRIEYFKSLLPLISGVKYLKHRQKIETRIENLENHIKYVEVQELLEEFG